MTKNVAFTENLQNSTKPKLDSGYLSYTLEPI